MRRPRPADVVSYLLSVAARTLSARAKRRLLLGMLHTIGRRLTPRRHERAADVLARLAVRRGGHLTRTVASNVDLVLDPSATAQERAATHLAALRTFYANWLDVAWMSALSTPDPRARVRLSGTDRVEALRAEGRGVVLVSFHTGRFELAAAGTAVELNGIVGVSRVMPSPVIQDTLVVARASGGNSDTVFVGAEGARAAAAGRLMRTLREGGVAAMMIERHIVGPRVTVPFLGGWIELAQGPVAMAMRTRAAILPSFVWQEDGVVRVHIGDELHITEGPSDAARCAATVREIAMVFEAWVRDHPHEWHLDIPLVT